MCGNVCLVSTFSPSSSPTAIDSVISCYACTYQSLTRPLDGGGIRVIQVLINRASNGVEPLCNSVRVLLLRYMPYFPNHSQLWQLLLGNTSRRSQLVYLLCSGDGHIYGHVIKRPKQNTLFTCVIRAVPNDTDKFMRAIFLGVCKVNSLAVQYNLTRFRSANQQRNITCL